MIAHAALPLAVALVVVSPSPSPAPALSPSPMPILAGVTLDENAAGVLLRVGVHARGGSSGSGLDVAVWPAQVQDIVIGIAYDQKVRVILVRGSSDPHGRCADPYGIRIADALEHLVAVRGHPDDVRDVDAGGDESIRYGPEKGVHWTFVVFGDKVGEIVLSDGT